MLTMACIRTQNHNLVANQVEKQSRDAIGWFDLKHITDISFEMDIDHINPEMVVQANLILLEIFGSDFEAALKTANAVRAISSAKMLVRVEGEAEITLEGFKKLALLNLLCKEYDARFICCDKRLLRLYPADMKCLFLPASSGFTVARAKTMLKKLPSVARPFILSCYGPSAGSSGRNTYVSARIAVDLAKECKQYIPISIINMGDEITYSHQLGLMELITIPGMGTPTFLNVVRQSTIVINLDTSPHTQGRMAVDAAVSGTPYVHTGWQAGGDYLWHNLALKSLSYDEVFELSREILNGKIAETDRAYQLVDDYDIENFYQILSQEVSENDSQS